METTKKLSKPTSQTQEVLFELINNPKGLTRFELMKYCFVLNAPQQISILRRKGLQVETITTEVTNKHGRKVKFGTYKLVSPGKAKQLYKELSN